MFGDHLGEICALSAPLAWSVALILYKRTDAPAVSMNLFKNSVGLAMLALTALILGAWPPLDRSTADWARLAFSGLLGLAVADTLLFEGLRRVGAARVAIVDTVYAPVVVLLSWAILGERPSLWFAAGAAAVVGGLGLATINRDAVRTEAGGQVWLGMGCVAAAVSCTAVGVIVAKPILEHSHLVEVTATRLAAGLIGQLVAIAALGGWRDASVCFRPGPTWKTMLPGAMIGTYLSLMLWLGGFKWGNASTAAVLNQMATVYILAQARFILGESLTRRQIAGAAMAAAGAVWIVATK
jgi:drug/metabolite transporter (DMT)-like permease